MDWIISTIAKIGNIIGPIGITIVVIIFALTVAFQSANIRSFEFKSRIFSFSISRNEKKNENNDEDDEDGDNDKNDENKQ